MYDIEEICIEKYGAKNIRRKNKWVVFKECPYEKHTKNKWTFGINVVKRFYHCFACDSGSKGSFGSLKSFTQYAQLDINVDNLFVYRDVKHKKKTKCKFPTYDIFGNNLEKVQRKAFAYLLKRCIPEHRIYYDELGTIHNEYYEGLNIRYRIVIPIWMHCKIVHIIFRDFTGKQKLRYLDLPNNSKSTVLGNYDEVHKNKFVYLVEGWVSAVKFDGLALLGKILHGEQIKELKKMPNLKHIEILLDEGAELNALRIADQLIGNGWKISILFIKRQPDDYTKEEIYNMSNKYSEQYSYGKKYKFLNKLT